MRIFGKQHALFAFSTVICVVFVGLTPIHAASEDWMGECDRLAADPKDPERTSEGVELDNIDAAAAIDACTKALEQVPNQPRIQYQLGRALRNGDRQDEAFEQILSAAEKGYVRAQSETGRLYGAGKGVTRDQRLALDWYERAANQGDLEALTASAAHYFFGVGTEKDGQEAIARFRSAAQGGYANAQYFLGVRYRNGEYVNRDFKKAIFWLQRAADQGFAQAMTELANMATLGEGRESPSREIATAWFKRAAEAGDRFGTAMLARAYDRGYGVPQDTEMAIEWYRRAAALGSSLAKSRLEELGASQ
jgi:hypothetical protein